MKCHLEGFETGSPLQELLRKILPLSWEEAAPLSPMEQMMQSILIIASDMGGPAEQIGDAGLKSHSAEPTALAHQMQNKRV
jgi:hypothetical protein